MKTLRRCLSYTEFRGFDIQTLCDIYGKFKSEEKAHHRKGFR